MDPARRFAYCCLALIALAAFGGQAFATSAAVGLCAAPGTHYTTIQAAVNAVPAGTKIEVCPGTYPEQVSITKNLTLLGIAGGSSDAAVIVTPAGGLSQTGTDIFGNAVAAQILVTGATAVTISHLTVDGSNNGLSGCSVDPIGIYYQNSAGTITYNAVRDQLMDPADQGCQIGLAINVESNTGSPAVTISNNSVRNYDKNGITASGPGTGGGPAVTVSSNTVIGIGPTSATAQNGIQIGYGATGSVTSNEVADDIYVNPPCGGNGEPSCYGSSGILIYASSGVSVSTNTVESTQLAIVPASDPTLGTANNTSIKTNHIGGTQTFDAIDLCSDSNTAETNIIYGSAQSGVHVDDECPPSTGSNNTVTKNTINEACAGVLLGSGSSNTVSPNTFANVTNTTMAGDVCTPLAQVKTREKHSSFRPSPRKPNRE
ncbi:MAG: right-handed parallel beta-helix repeat-containing protein [Terriglobales bacterium]